MKDDQEKNPYQKYDDLFDAQNKKEVRANKKEKNAENQRDVKINNRFEDHQHETKKTTRNNQKNLSYLLFPFIGFAYVVGRIFIDDRNIEQKAIVILSIVFVGVIMLLKYANKK